MTAAELRTHFLKQFDVVGIINKENYIQEALKLHEHIGDITYDTIVVLGLSYPKRIMKHTETHLVPSFYTFGSDYHTVLKHRIDLVMKDLDYDYISGVDNHEHDERLAATLSKVGYFGKNQLIINKDYGTYMFLGMVFVDVKLDKEFILDIDDDCGTCTKCISACPTNALSEEGYLKDRCISYFNQEKKVLTDEEMDANYALFGCDICQMVCPKNVGKGTKVHPEFELSGKEMVSIIDMFNLSQKKFNQTYENMSYLWKGKTILLRNALMVMLKQKNMMYIDEIKASIHEKRPSWYNATAKRVLERLEHINKD